MARYIDADKLIAHLKDEIEGCKPPFGGRANGKSIAYGTELGLKSAISFAETLSTADVAPKSEVERLSHKCDECAGCTQWKCDCANIKLEVAREIFEDIWASIATHAFTAKSEDYEDGAYDTIEWVDSKIAEVEKKYTEGESNGSKQ